MKLTVISKTILGFSLILLLLIGISVLALNNQSRVGQLFQVTTSETVPQMQDAYRLVIALQNANKAVSQHAAVNEEDLLELYEADFEAENRSVRAQYERLHEDLASKANSQALLENAFEPIDRSLILAEQHLNTRREVLDSRQAFLQEYQNQDARWLTFANDMRVVDRVLENLAQERDAVSGQVGADARYVLDRIALIRSGVTAIGGLETSEVVEGVKANLERELGRLDSRIERLQENNEIVHQYLSTYVGLLNVAVNDAEGSVPLYYRSLLADERSSFELAQLADSVNTAVARLNSLTQALSDESARVATQVEDANREAGTTVLIGLVISLGLAVLIIISLVRSIRRPLRTIMTLLAKVSTGNLSEHMNVTSQDEFAQIGEGINKLIDDMKVIINDIKTTSMEVESVTTQVKETTSSSSQKLLQQKDQSASIATAVTELNSSAREISDSASNTLNQVQDVNGSASEGQQNMAASNTVIGQLVTDLNSASTVVNELKEESDNIGQILEVIQGIAEQTNLLALNAAIEAARAGDQGRGFAVVADEVRNLASKTQSSTEEIYQMIDTLQTKATQAVDFMTQNLGRVDTLVQRAGDTDESIQVILKALGQITDLSEHIAEGTASQQQTAEEVSRAIADIAQLSDDIYNNAGRNAKTFDRLSELVDHQNKTVSRFQLS
ncbi:MAG: methyl-accepting chemotaxis protein [Saccharospirillum sp.]|nr:methyl-accepting chemotaxis protein [Saccharospirillum sp.]